MWSTRDDFCRQASKRSGKAGLTVNLSAEQFPKNTFATSTWRVMEVFMIGTGRGRTTGPRRTTDNGEPDRTSSSGFPSLDRLLGENNRSSASAMRAKLTGTIQLLERVIRQGTKTDVMRAQRALEAWKLALTFLDQLES